MDLEERIKQGRELKFGEQVGDYFIIGNTNRNSKKEESSKQMGIIYNAIAKTDSASAILKGLNYENLKILLNEGKMEAAKVHFDYFDDETKFLQRLRHPNIVAAYRPVSYKGMSFVPLEYIPEKFEDAFNEKNKFTLKEFSVQACDVMEYLQREGVVHADIKMDNFRYDPQERKIKVIDFGIASDLGKGECAPKGLSKKDYLPPEAFQNKLSPSYDVYGLGELLKKASSIKKKIHVDRDAPTSPGGKPIQPLGENVPNIDDSLLLSIIYVCQDPDPAKRDLGLVRELAKRLNF